MSENFREMAENGIDAWESLQSQNQRLTDAYDQHADEINRIKDLTGLSFETVAAAWAGNKDAVDVVTRAYTEQKTELRNTLGGELGGRAVHDPRLGRHPEAADPDA